MSVDVIDFAGLASALTDRPAGPSGLCRSRSVSSTRELVAGGTQFTVVYRLKPGARRIEVLRVLHGAALASH